MTADRRQPSERNHRLISRTTDFRAHIDRWRRQAEEYRILADAAETDVARKSYSGLAADYDGLADRAEEILAADTF